MCEMLVMREDKVNEDPVMDASCLKSGMVITIQEDGWEWSKEELDHPRWIVLRLPDVSVEEMEKKLLQTESQKLLEKNPLDPKADPVANKALQQRAFKIDLAALPEKELTLKDIETATVELTALANPLVIG